MNSRLLSDARSICKRIAVYYLDMDPGTSRVQVISGELIADVLRQARESPRRRMNYNFHASAGENPNRFLNVILEGSYVAPHRHSNPPKPEAFVVIEGRLAFFIFDDSGAIREAHVLGRESGDAAGIDVPPDTWHTLAVLTPHAVCYEVKPGPYSPAADKDFAPWAPREGDPAAPAYLEALLRRL